MEILEIRCFLFEMTNQQLFGVFSCQNLNPPPTHHFEKAKNQMRIQFNDNIYQLAQALEIVRVYSDEWRPLKLEAKSK